MPGENKTEQTQQQHSVTEPWAPTRGLLGDIVGRLGGVSTAPTTAQTNAIQALTQATGEVPNFGGAASDVVRAAFGTSTAPQAGMLNQGYNRFVDQITPYASGARLDPMANPEFKNALDTVNQDITNQISSTFAAGGRPVGSNAAGAQALARGLAQGEGGMLANQFNQNVANQFNASNALNAAAGTTAGGLTQQQMTQLQARQSGIGAAGAVPGLYTAPAAGMLNAAQTGYNLPFSNLQGLEGLLLPIAGLGAESTGTAQGETTQKQSPWGNIMGGAMLAASLFSDENVKENKVPVGMLFDGQPVWSYNYIGDPTPRIGLMAQEVEDVRPDAVSEVAGIKAVHYGLATETSRAIGAGMLADEFAMAA